MADTNNINAKESQENKPVPKPGEILSVPEPRPEQQDAPEPQEASDQKELRQKIEAMDVDDSVKPQVSQTAQDIKTAGQDEKIKKLLLVAEQKGVVYAVSVAKKMDDPHVLDVFHDALAAQGFYKKFKE